MENKRMSELQVATTIEDDDYTIIVQGGVNKRVSRGIFKQKEYNNLNNRPYINSNYSSSLVPALELLQGTIQFHKISKTGKYGDLLDLPYIPVKISDLTNDGYFVQDQYYVHTDNNLTSGMIDKLNSAIQAIKVNNNLLPPNASQEINITMPTRLSDLTNDGNFVQDQNYVHTDNNFNTNMKNSYDNLVVNVNQPVSATNKIATMNDLSAIDGGYWVVIDIYKEILFDGVINTSETVPATGTYAVLEFKNNILVVNKYTNGVSDNSDIPFKEGYFVFVAGTESEVIYYIKENAWCKLGTDLGNYYNKQASDNRYVAKESGKSLMTSAERTKLNGISTGANKVEASNTNGNIKIDGVETTVYTKPALTNSEVITAIGFTPANVTALSNYYNKTESDNRYVAQENGKSLISTTEITRLAGMSTGANKVEASNTNGNIKIDGVETTIYTKPTLTSSEVTTALGFTPANSTSLSNYYDKDDSDDRYVQKEIGKSLIASTKITKLDGISTGANKVEESNTNGNIKIDGVETTVYTKPALTSSEVITALGYTPVNPTTLSSDYYTKQNSDNRYVQKETGKGLISTTEITRLAGMSTGANKVEESETNGNIVIDGTEVTVYTKPDLTNSEVITAIGFTPANVTALSNYYNKTESDNRYVAQENGKSLINDTKITKLDGISTQANKVEHSNTNGNVLIDGVETVVYVLSKGAVIEALGYTPIEATVDLIDYYDKQQTDNKFVAKENGKSLISTTEITKLSGISAGANKVEASNINGNIKIDGVETTVYTKPALTNSEVITAIGFTPANVTALSNYYNKTESDNRYVAKENGKSLISTTEITRLAGMSTGANKVEESETNGNIVIDGTEVTVYTKPALTSSEVTTALGFTPANSTALSNYYNKTESDNKYVAKENGKSLISTTEITRLAGMSTGANKVEESETNGNIIIDGTEVIVYTKPTLTNSEVITAIGFTPANVTALSNYYNKTESDNKYVAKETGKSLIASTKITKLDGISTGANKVESSNTNGNIKIDGVETTVYTKPALTSSEVTTALGFTPANSTSLSDYYEKDDSDDRYVQKETGKSLIASTKITKLDGISTGANKVEASNTNGNIKIDGVETTVYTKPALTKSEVTTALGYTPPTSSVATTSANGLMSKDMLIKLNGISTGATKVQSSNTNGNILIDGTEVTVYTKPALTKSEVVTALGYTPPTQDTNTTYDVVSASSNGLMTSDMLAKLNGITADADSVSFTRSLSSGTKIGTITINGTATDLYAPTDTNTHYTTHLYAGTSSGNSNAATSNGNTYLMVLDNTTVRDRRLIRGTGGATVTSDSNGNITINAKQEPVTIYADFMTNLNNYSDGTDLTEAEGLTMEIYDKMKPGVILEYTHPYSYSTYCYSLILGEKSYYSYKDVGGRYYIRLYIILDYNGNLGYYYFSSDPLAGGTSVYKGSNLDQGESGGVACFTGDTLINTENGLKPIRELKLDEKVYSKNSNNEIQLKEIVKTFSHITDKIYKIYTDSNIINSSWSHPFYVCNKGKLLAQDLKIGDKLLDTDNNTITIKNIEILSEPTLVFEIRVKDNENYFVGTDKILVGCEKI